MKDLDILYYDYMIESVAENRKIMELIASSSSILENSNELMIYEGKMIENIVNAIKEIFQKVIDFVRDIIKKITGNKVFTPNEKLIKACNEKLKNMSKDEKDNFIIKGISLRGKLIGYVDWANDSLDDMYDLLDKITDECNNFTNGKTTNGPSFNKKIVDDCLSEIEKKENREELKKDAKDADIITIQFCLDPSRATYANSKNATTNAINYSNKVQKEMKDMQRTMDQKVNASKNNELNTQTMNEYRTAIYSITNCIMKLFKFTLNMSILQFKNEEAILRKFISMPSSAKQESAAYFEGALESIIYDEYTVE